MAANIDLGRNKVIHKYFKAQNFKLAIRILQKLRGLNAFTVTLYLKYVELELSVLYHNLCHTIYVIMQIILTYT